MADYAIGDVQGCYDALRGLLEVVDFNDRVDRLWFVGDLVNRGTQSLEVLRFIHQLPLPAVVTLGNHDLHLLACLFGGMPLRKGDTLEAILRAPDAELLGHWLRTRPVLHHAPEYNLVMCHAGIAPVWDIHLASQCAKALETCLAGDDYRVFLSQMYGNEPLKWSQTLTGIPRLRSITNYFTRMRFCDAQGGLVLSYKGSPAEAPYGIIPWFEIPQRKPIAPDIVFGHWAALEGKCSVPGLYALDTGCIWGGALTALRLHDRQLFSYQKV